MFLGHKKVSGRTCLVLPVVCVVFLASLQYRYNSSYFQILQGHSNNVLTNGSLGIQRTAKGYFLRAPLQIEATVEKLGLLARLIYSAKKHVRGSKTSQYLKRAISIMDDILREINVDVETVRKRPSKNPKSVCSEEFRGGDFGFPLYHEGWVTKKCKHAVPLQKLITIVKYIDGSQFSSFDKILNYINSVKKTYESVRVLIAVDFAKFPELSKVEYPWVNITSTSKLTEGAALNKLIEQVRTPYILVARSTQIMTNESRIERLIGEIESLDVVAAGGAFRYPNGHWGRGCFQTAYRNYTLKYVEGYDESFHECVFCDYIQGPFVTTIKYFKQNKFQNLNEKSGLYEDWFLRMSLERLEAVVCPDSMYYVYNLSRSNSDLKAFMQKWNVAEMFTPSGETFSFDLCKVHKLKNLDGPSRATAPCSLQTNNDAVKVIMKVCEDLGAMCELQEGTLLGALKMGRVLPWDNNYDIRYATTSCPACKKLQDGLRNSNVSVESFAYPCCTKKLVLGERIFVHIYYKECAGDFAGHPYMDSDRLTRASLPPTKVLYDGEWVNVPENPGLALRNRYGKEMYQHAEHWKYVGGKKPYGRLNYTTNRFLPCKYPGRHDCLDMYNGDGVLQFFYLLP